MSLLTLLRFQLFSCSRELRYALFTAGPAGGFDSSGAVPAIELAEEMINSDSSILPGYSLTHTTVYDTMVRSRLKSRPNVCETYSMEPNS